MNQKMGLILTWAILYLCGCKMELTPKKVLAPISERVTWEGRLAFAYALDSIKGLHSFSFLGMDTLDLKLQEFPHEYLAYAAFSQKAHPEDMQEGFYREASSLIFIHGRFLGEMQYLHSGLIPTHFLKSNLNFIGEELFSIPPEFQAFPTLGRVAHSERVSLKNFMGIGWKRPIFSAQYFCHEDTGTAFRVIGADSMPSLPALGWSGKVDTLEWGKELLFQGQNELHETLLYWTYPQGILGIIGCFDPVLALAYAQKIKKMTVLIPKS